MNTCPHCRYQNGWVHVDDDPVGKDVRGECGDFWTNPVSMERNFGSDWHDDGKRTAHLCGCPRCMKVFIDERY